jgi:hypothetical protein
VGRGVTGTVATAAVIGASIACLFVLNSFFQPHYDFNSFWGAGRALLEGRNPYDYAVIRDILYPRSTANFNYPLFIAILVVPLALLDLETAKNVWLTVSEVLFVISIYLASGSRPRKPGLMLSTLACAAFVPTVITFFDQQTSMLALFLLSLGYYALRKDRHMLAGSVLALALFKPQTVALVAIVSLFRLRREGLIAFAATLVILLAIAFALMPDWPLQWWSSASWLTREAGRAVPTVWGLSWYLTSQYWLGVLLAMGLLAAVFINSEFTFVLATGLLLPVYMKPYDLVLLLIPAVSRPGRRLLTALVVTSYALLLYIAWSNRGGDVFVLLTIIAYSWLMYQDKALMGGRIQRFRLWARSHLTV